MEQLTDKDLDYGLDEKGLAALRRRLVAGINNFTSESDCRGGLGASWSPDVCMASMLCRAVKRLSSLRLLIVWVVIPSMADGSLPGVPEFNDAHHLLG